MKGSKAIYKQASELGEDAFLLLFSQVNISTCMRLFNSLFLCSSLILFISRKTIENISNSSLKHLSSYLVLSQRL